MSLSLTCISLTRASHVPAARAARHRLRRLLRALGPAPHRRMLNQPRALARPGHRVWRVAVQLLGLCRGAVPWGTSRGAGGLFCLVLAPQCKLTCEKVNPPSLYQPFRTTTHAEREIAADKGHNCLFSPPPPPPLPKQIHLFF
jgi:hypothetical protein